MIAWIFTHVRYEKAPRAREAMHGTVRQPTVTGVKLYTCNEPSGSAGQDTSPSWRQK